jgi:glycosyltransferase involved in cell wall biosynthesis
VRRQTLLPDEVIFVDDASGDGTADLLRRLVTDLQRSMRAKLITLQSNQGAAGARNAGWDAAQGCYVAFLDADSTWHPQKLELQIACMEAHPDVAISGHRHRVPGGDFNLGWGDGAITPIGFDQLLWSNRFTTSSAVVRRTMPLRFTENQRHMEDHRLWLDAARASHKIVRIEKVLAAHHKPDFGASGLSADLIAMEKGELRNYRALFDAGAIGRLKLGALQAWSLAKFMRRLALVGARRISTARDT